MGLNIHYSGQLKEANMLSSLINEVEDIVRVNKWKHHIYETVFPENKFCKNTAFDKIFGISFLPTNCETISITFLSNGLMVCPTRVHLFGDSNIKEERDWIYTTSVKTQFAGIKTHRLIILLFKYLDKKYFANFKLFDESGYWETNDEVTMKKQFQKYDSLIENFALAVETFPAQKNENIMAYIERLLKNVNRL